MQIEICKAFFLTYGLYLEVWIWEDVYIIFSKLKKEVNVSYSISKLFLLDVNWVAIKYIFL